MSEAKTKHISAKTIALTAFVLAVALAVYVIWRLDTEPRTDDAYVYADTINVTPQVNGTIVDLPVKDNQNVKQGDILLRIDPRPYEDTLNKAHAGLAALEKEIETAQRMIEAQKYTADATGVNVEKTKAAMAQARTTLSRLEPLRKDGFASAEQIDLARTSLQIAEKQHSEAILAHQSALSAVADVDALMAKREVMKSDIALAELQLEHATVRAPFDGRVLGLRTTAGQFAAAGHPVFTLADTRTWHIVANFRETDLNAVKVGAPARVYILSDTGRKFSARVESIGFGVYPDDGGLMLNGLPVVKRSINWVRVAQRFPVKFVVENPDPELFRIGASAVVLITGNP